MKIPALLQLPLGLAAGLVSALASPPTAAPDLVFAERDGLVAFEAEHFQKQELTTVRAWHVIHAGNRPKLSPDTDGTHVIGASGGAYLEALPDSRWTHSEKLVPGENFSPEPGKLAVLSYQVHFTTPGRYYVWARIFSTGTEDNGVHFGLDGTWPGSGQNWQTVKKKEWSWDSRQRTVKIHVGVPGQLFLDVPTAGVHTIHISMREDGFELDKIILTSDANFVPVDHGPDPQIKHGILPTPFPMGENYQEAPAPTSI